MGSLDNVYLNAPEEWPPVDFVQGPIIDIRGQTIPPVFLIVCDQMFSASHLNGCEYEVCRCPYKVRTTPVLWTPMTVSYAASPLNQGSGPKLSQALPE